MGQTDHSSPHIRGKQLVQVWRRLFALIYQARNVYLESGDKYIRKSVDIAESEIGRFYEFFSEIKGNEEIDPNFNPKINTADLNDKQRVKLKQIGHMAPRLS